MPATLTIARPERDEYLEYYGKYIQLVPGDDAMPVIATQLEDTLRLLRPLSDAQALHRYAPGKWSVKEVVGHLCDGERVFSYRALRFARADATPLPGFEENAYVPAGGFDARPIAELIDEYAAIRASTVTLYRGLDPAALVRRGEANGAEITPRALAWIIAGHERHHRALLVERYGLKA